MPSSEFRVMASFREDLHDRQASNNHNGPAIHVDSYLYGLQLVT